MTNNPINVILVNWNGWRDTLKCVTSLLCASPTPRLRVIVVDNASRDDSVRQIELGLSELGFAEYADHGGKSQRREVRRIRAFLCPGQATVDAVWLVQSNSNLGFAGGNNLGVDLAENTFPSEYYWFLNNDTTVDELAARKLLDEMTADPRIGICGSTLVFAQQPQHIQAMAGVKYNHWTGRGHQIGSGMSRDALMRHADVLKRLTYVSGASMFVSRSFIVSVGVMSEDYFLYQEELDWAWRGQGKYRLGWASQSLVYHDEGASIGTASANRIANPKSDFFQTRSKVIFSLRHCFPSLPIIGFFALARATRYFIQGHNQNGIAVLRGLVLSSKTFQKFVAG